MGFKLDYREFNATLKRYQELHRRKTAPQIVNKKALYIARGAIRETQRPGPTVIGRALSQIIFTFKKSRKKLTMRKTYGSHGEDLSAPVAALLVNFRRGKQGEKGLYGSAMKEAINHLIGRANSARAFLASGWIPAVKKLTPLVRDKKDMPANDVEAGKIRRPFGDGIPATTGTEISIARIINDNLSRFTTTPEGGVFDKAAKGLQKAINNEQRSMAKHVEEEMRKSAHELGIRTN